VEVEVQGREPLRQWRKRSDGVGKGCGCGGSSSSGSLSKPIGDECQRCGKMGHRAHECRSKAKKE
jgi:hypothetical protein